MVVLHLRRQDLEVMDLMDHLVVVQVVEWEHLLDLVAQHHLFQHLKVVMVVMLVAIQTTNLLVMDLVEEVVLVPLVLTELAQEQEMVEMEFRYQTFRLLSEKMDTLLVVEQVVKPKMEAIKLVVPVVPVTVDFLYLSEMLHLVQVAVVLAHLDLILADLRVDPVAAVVVE